MTKESMRGWTLVAVQGLLFLAVAVTALLQVGPVLFVSLWLAIVLVLVGAAGVIGSGRNLGRSLTPSPVPNREGLTASGLYRYARHPMYTALIVICLGVAVGSGVLGAYLAVLALAVFFDIKGRIEENYLVTAYEGYAGYAASTGKFVPGVGLRSFDRATPEG